MTGRVLHVISKSLPAERAADAEAPSSDPDQQRSLAAARRWKMWNERLAELENDDPARYTYRVVAPQDRLRVSFAALDAANTRSTPT